MRELIDKLKEKWTAAREAANELVRNADAEGRELSEDQSNRFDALMDQHKRLGADIARREALLDAELSETKSERQSQPMAPGTAAALITPESHITFPYRAKQLKAFRGTDAIDRAYKCGMWLRWALFKHEQSRNWCQDRGMELRVMTEGVNTAGGFTVPDEFEAVVIDLREQYGVFRKYAHIHNMASDHTVIPRRTGGLSAYPVGEKDAITASDKSWDNVGLTAKKWGVLARFSSDLSEDSIVDLADDLAQEAAYAFATKEDDCGFNGDGSSTYHGIYGILQKLADRTTYAAGSHTAGAGHDQFVLYDAADLTGVMAALPAYADDTAKWYCSKVAQDVTFNRLAIAYGGNNMRDVAEGNLPRYMGYDIVKAQKMPTAQTDISGEIVMLFGDLAKAATLGSRRGMTVKLDESRYLEYDQLAVRCTTRWDINVHDVGDATTAGPIIGLEAET